MLAVGAYSRGLFEGGNSRVFDSIAFHHALSWVRSVGMMTGQYLFSKHSKLLRLTCQQWVGNGMVDLLG